MGVSLFRVAMPDLDPNDVVLCRLSGLAPLSPLDSERVLALSFMRRASPAQTELCAAGEVAPRPRFLIQGWACRLRTMPDGRRQIFDLVLPGDLIGSCLRPHQPAAAATVALTQVEMASAAMFGELASQASPANGNGGSGLVEACAALERQSEMLLLDQITRLGRQTAYERTVHLLIEIRHRLAAVGLADSNSFPLPLRQDTMADLLGLSVVHVNRTLQQMRRDRVIELRAGIAVLLKPDRLRAAADFSPPLSSTAN